MPDYLAYHKSQTDERAMWLQRTHSIFAERVRRGDERTDMGTIDIPDNRSWYPYSELSAGIKILTSKGGV